MESEVDAAAAPFFPTLSFARRAESLISQVHTIWDAPLQVFIYTRILRSTLGTCVNRGMLVLLLSVPISTLLVSLAAKIRRRSLRWRDQRYRLMSDFIDNAKVRTASTEDDFDRGSLQIIA